jgi:hypothetical protein
MKNKQLIKTVFLVSALSFSSATIAAWCPPYIVPWVAGIFASTQASLLGFLSGVMGKITFQNKMDSDRITSAVAVLTKQKAVGAQKIMQAQTKSAEVMARAYASIKQNERVKEARLSYGAEFGQGYDVCRVTAVRELMDQKWQKSDENTAASIKNELEAPLGKYDVSRDVVKQRLLTQLQTYCTPDQEKLGVCKQTAQSNTNLQVTSLFRNTAPKTPEHQAKIDFINQLVGLPDDPIDLGKTNDSSVKAANYKLAKLQKDALVSPAIYSLKYIQNLYTKQGSTSPIEVLQYETKRYMAAGKDGQNWYKSMTTQQQRGILLELLKLKALDLNIQYKQYQQQGRTELILANLLASEAQKLKATPTAN